ncbi:hypothetical protein CDAR_318711 [Caerostris darwini]|uniref:RNase H type-1 domain-containing protein n=1 Tax=Caerostris darwini TaxID=1538125 RepID=A0AAV4MJL9_9ARAC|nr:hypothetical protein CDAR_318711 [Caerostris darwini]
MQNITISAADLEDPPTIEPPWEKMKFEWKFHQEQDSGCCIFPDGSKMGNRVGCAMVVYTERAEIFHSCKRLNDEASVYMAEMNAIKLAIEHIIHNRIP